MLEGAGTRMVKLIRALTRALALTRHGGCDQLLRRHWSWDLRPGAFGCEASVGVAADE